MKKENQCTEFEVWAESKGIALEQMSDGEYLWGTARDTYEAWQAAIAEYRQSRGEPVSDIPLGAIENGRVFADRLESDYSFECQAGPLRNCSDWQEFRRCFEHLAEWAMHAPQSAESAETEEDIEAAAKTLAKCMDYPWESMPTQGRIEMRKHAQAVLSASRRRIEGEPVSSKPASPVREAIRRNQGMPGGDV